MTAPAACAEVVAETPQDEVLDLLQRAIEIVALELRCDTRTAALFAIKVLLRCPEFEAPTVH